MSPEKLSSDIGTGVPPDHIAIQVRATDQGGLATEQSFTVDVSNVNEPPTDIGLWNATLAEDQPGGTTVGTWSTTWPDAQDSFTYGLFDGRGTPWPSTTTGRLRGKA